jgi:hypothetical protein
MPRIPREVIEHKLDIDPSFKPIKQKERRYTPERRETIRAEVNKLLEAELSTNQPCHRRRRENIVHHTI